jgi:succinoglycan biosynthesis transport protein ExoP
MDEIQKHRTIQLEAIAPAGPQAIQQEQLLDISPEDAPHLLDYWQVVLKRRWTVLACLFVVFATVAIGTLKKKPIYEAKVELEINPEEPQVLNFKEISQAAPTVDVDSYRETQYKVLQSRTLAERVVNDLRLYQLPEFYRNRGIFGLFQSNPKKIPSRWDPGTPDPSIDAYRNAVSCFRNSVDVSPVRRSNLVDVTFDSYDPQLAALAANKLADDYIKQNLQVKWDETVQASEWLQGKLVELKGKLEKAEDNLQAYATRNGIVFISEKENMVNARLEGLLTEYTKAQTERYSKESLYSLVESGKVQDLPGVLDNRLVQDLEEKLADSEKEYAQATTWVKPDYPRARQIQKQINSLQAKIEKEKRAVIQNISDNYHTAVQHESFLAKAVENQKKEVQDIANRSIQYNILKREVDTNKQLYEGLLQRMKEAQVSAGLKASNIRIVDSAEVPKYPAKPRVFLNLSLGAVLGLGVGVGLAFFQEYLDKTLKTPEEVEKLLRLPSLGVLPRFALNGSGKGSAQEDLVIAAPEDKVAIAPAIQTDPETVEAYRSLRTSILLSASPVPRLLLVTSALPGEGKTTTTVNLGATLASLGSRVVIVDCDMRRPACHRSAGVENKPGFVQCLTGHVGLAEAVLPVPGVPNLSVIPCGPIPPNPAEVLSSRVTGELLHKLRNEFEYVLVDSPPLLSVADSRILATLTEAAILVTRAFETPYDVIWRARALLYGAGARILGVALNDVDLQRESYGSNSYYRYGYGGYASQAAEESGGYKST